MPLAGSLSPVAPSGARAAPSAAPPPAAAAPPPAPAAAAAPPAETTPPAAGAPPAGTPPPAAAPAAAETPPAAGAPPPKPEQGPDAWRFAALAKKDRAIREESEKVKAEKAAIVAERQQLEQERTQRQQRSALYKTNPMAALEDAGLSYEELTQFVLNNQNLTPAQAAKIAIDAAKQSGEEIAALRREQAETFERQQKSMQEAQAKSEAQRAEHAKTAYLDELRGLVTAAPDSYEMVGLAGDQAIQAMYEVAEEKFKETGRVPTNKEVADAVEARLFAEAEKAVKASKKLGRLFAPPPPAPPPPAPAPSRTISNRMTPAPSARPDPAGESEAARKARVLDLIKRSMGG
jgi:hypothetical protein